MKAKWEEVKAPNPTPENPPVDDTKEIIATDKIIDLTKESYTELSWKKGVYTTSTIALSDWGKKDFKAEEYDSITLKFEYDGTAEDEIAGVDLIINSGEIANGTTYKNVQLWKSSGTVTFDITEFKGKIFQFIGLNVYTTTNNPVGKIKVTTVYLNKHVDGAETSSIIYEGAGFVPYDDKFDAKTLNSILANSKSKATLVITYKLNDYTPAYDNDGVGKFAGWKVTVGGKDDGSDLWENSTDNFDSYGLNTGCKKDEYVAGTDVTKNIDVETLLSDLPNTDIFTINLWPIAEGESTLKVTITKIEVVYVAK